MTRIEKDTPATSGMGAGGCLVRLGWMMLGNVALLLTLVAIARRPNTLSYADALFWAIVAFCIGLRYLDIRRFGGLTATSQPATLTHWRRYALLLAAVSAAAWGAAHALAFYFSS
jgi:hypothetical protein